MQTMDSHSGTWEWNDWWSPFVRGHVGFHIFLIPKDATDAAPIPNKVDLAMRTRYQKCRDLSRTNCGDIVGHSHAKYSQFIKSSKGQHKYMFDLCWFTYLYHAMVIPCPIGIPAKQNQPLVRTAMDITYKFLTDRKISIVLTFPHLLDRPPLKLEYGDILY